MADDAPITELIRQFKSGKRDAANVIVAYFWESARRVAHDHLSRRVRLFKSGSDIANAAMRSALSYLEKPNAVIESRDDFEKLVLDIVTKRAADAGRRATAKKRSIRRQTELPEWDMLASNADLADQLSMAGELGERIENMLMQERDDETQAITRMGIISHLAPKEIQDELASHSSDGAPSIRTIQKDIQLAKMRLADALREEFGKMVPEKVKPKKKQPRKKTGSASKKKTKTAPKKTARRRKKNS